MLDPKKAIDQMQSEFQAGAAIPAGTTGGCLFGVLEMTQDEIILAQQARIEQLVNAIVQFRNEPCLGRAIAVRATAGYLAMERAAIDTNDDLSALRAHDAELLERYRAEDAAWKLATYDN